MNTNISVVSDTVIFRSRVRYGLLGQRRDLPGGWSTPLADKVWKYKLCPIKERICWAALLDAGARCTRI